MNKEGKSTIGMWDDRPKLDRTVHKHENMKNNKHKNEELNITVE